MDEQAAIDKLKKNWEVQETDDLSVEKKVATLGGYFASTASYIFKSAGDILYKLGIIGAASGTASRYAVGYAAVHPGYFMTAILSSVAFKYGAESV